MSAVANVAINLDSRGVPQKLKQVADRSKELEKAVQGASTAVTKTGRELKTAANGMQYFIDATGRARKANGQFVTTAEAAAAGLEKQGRSASLASNGLNGLAKGLLGAAAGFATVGTAAALAGRAIQSAIGRTESERRLEILAAGYNEVAEIQNVAASSAKLFGQSQTETNQAIASAYARLRPLGISLQDISSTYNGFNTAARLSGATAQESSAAFTQLAQALGSGVLRGDEFNSIAEQAPGLLQAISRELGVAVGELRDYAQKGKITSDVVINALKAIEKEGASPLAEAMGGPEQKLKDLQNETDNLSAEIGKLALPALIQVISELTGVIKTAGDNTKIFSQVMNGLGKEFQFILGPLASFYEYIGGIPGIISNSVGALFSMLGPLKQLAQLIAFVSGKTLGPEVQRLQGIGAYTGMADAPEDVRKALAEPKLPARSVRIGDTVGGGGGGGGAGTGSSGNKAADELKRQQEAGVGLLTQQERQIKLKLTESSLEKELLQIEYDRLDALKQIESIAPEQRDQATRQANTLAQMQAGEAIGKTLAEQVIKEQELQQARKDALRPLEQQRELLEAKLNGTEKEFRFRQRVDEIMNQAPGLERATVEELLRGNDALEQRVTKMQEMEQLLGAAAQRLGKGLEDALVATIEAAVTGAKDLGETLQGIASSLLKDVGRMFIRAGISGLGARLGLPGFADGGFAAPGRSYVVGERGPELLTMGPSGGYVTSNSASQAAMERYSSGNARGGSISVNYNVTDINGMRFVTEDQFRAGVAQAAKQGADGGFNRTMSSLKNNRSTRSRIGV